ncbi:MAG: PLDc N-terminal domain-containing protein [Eubacteriales bacterium]
MQSIIEFLPFVIPLLIIELLLAITALIHILKHPNYRFGNRTLWILIVLLIQIIGPVVYFIFGRVEE